MRKPDPDDCYFKMTRATEQASKILFKCKYKELTDEQRLKVHDALVRRELVEELLGREIFLNHHR